MPRFFFHVEAPGSCLLDEEGSEYENAEAAEAGAVAAIRSLHGKGFLSPAQVEALSIRLMDGEGKMVTRVHAGSAIAGELLHDGASDQRVAASGNR